MKIWFLSPQYISQIGTVYFTFFKTLRKEGLNLYLVSIEKNICFKFTPILLSSFQKKILFDVLFVVKKGKPPPPGSLRATNVQAQYIILTWDEPQHGSSYQIHNYTVERKNEGLDSFIMVKTLPYSSTGMTMENLKPSTEYTIRLSSNNKYGKSDGILLTQGTLPGRLYNRSFVTEIAMLMSFYDPRSLKKMTVN